MPALAQYSPVDFHQKFMTMVALGHEKISIRKGTFTMVWAVFLTQVEPEDVLLEHLYENILRISLETSLD